MRKILEKCPTCSSQELIVTELRCARCDTTVRSTYRPTVFSQLSDENLRFIEIFVKNKGNVKDMERELGVSYWTIRGRLDDIIASLNFDVPPSSRRQGGSPAATPPDPSPVAAQEKSRQQQRILDALEAGALSVQEAADQLARLED